MTSAPIHIANETFRKVYVYTRLVKHDRKCDVPWRFTTPRVFLRTLGSRLADPWQPHRISRKPNQLYDGEFLLAGREPFSLLINLIQAEYEQATPALLAGE